MKGVDLSSRFSQILLFFLVWTPLVFSQDPQSKTHPALYSYDPIEEIFFLDQEVRFSALKPRTRDRVSSNATLESVGSLQSRAGQAEFEKFWEKLGHTKDSISDIFCDAYGQYDEDEAIAVLSVRLEEQKTPEAKMKILNLFTENVEDPEIASWCRWQILRTLGTIGGKSAYPIILPYLDDDDSYLRRGAIEGLYAAAPLRAVEVFKKRIFIEKEHYIRDELLSCIRGHDKKFVAQWLLSNADGNGENLATQIADLDDPSFLPALRKHLTQIGADTTHAGITPYLAKMGDRPSLELLYQGLIGPQRSIPFAEDLTFSSLLSDPQYSELILNRWREIGIGSADWFDAKVSRAFLRVIREEPRTKALPVLAGIMNLGEDGFKYETLEALVAEGSDEAVEISESYIQSDAWEARFRFLPNMPYEDRKQLVQESLDLLTPWAKRSPVIRRWMEQKASETDEIWDGVGAILESLDEDSKEECVSQSSVLDLEEQSFYITCGRWETFHFEGSATFEKGQVHSFKVKSDLNLKDLSPPKSWKKVVLENRLGDYIVFEYPMNLEKNRPIRVKLVLSGQTNNHLASMISYDIWSDLIMPGIHMEGIQFDLETDLETNQRTAEFYIQMSHGRAVGITFD